MGINLTDREAILIILAFFLPPLAVFLKTGLYADFWINLGLTILGWAPGIVHGWYIIITNAELRGQEI